MTYRINYSQGQVSRSFASLKEAKRELEFHRPYAHFDKLYIQKYIGDGEWARVR